MLFSNFASIVSIFTVVSLLRKLITVFFLVSSSRNLQLNADICLTNVLLAGFT